MSNCVFCHAELTAENSAKEHTIPNAIGGRLKSSDLDCVKCNSECGADCDDALARDLNPLANLLGIERDRGEPQPIDGVVGGKGVRLDAAGKPEFAKPELEVKEDGKKVEIKLAARSMSEARRMIEGLARKFPIDVEAAMKQAQFRQTYLPDFVEFKFAHGGKDTFRAVTKIAYLFLEHKRPGQALDRKAQIVEFIKGTCDYKSVYFLPGERVVQPAAGEVLHVVVITGYAPSPAWRRANARTAPPPRARPQVRPPASCSPCVLPVALKGRHREDSRPSAGKSGALTARTPSTALHKRLQAQS